MTVHSPDLYSEHLQTLSGEVNRIATALARLSSTANEHNPIATSVRDIQIPPKMIRREIRARRLRARYFEEDLFADPAWDLLLDLFEAEIREQKISVSSACTAAGVPATTALRWITALVKRGLLIRQSDPLDGRRVFVALAPSTSDAMHRYFAEVLLSA